METFSEIVKNNYSHLRTYCLLKRETIQPTGSCEKKFMEIVNSSVARLIEHEGEGITYTKSMASSPYCTAIRAQLQPGMQQKFLE